MVINMTDTALLTEEYRGGLLDLTHYGYIAIIFPLYLARGVYAVSNTLVH